MRRHESWTSASFFISLLSVSSTKGAQLFTTEKALSTLRAYALNGLLSSAIWRFLVQNFEYTFCAALSWKGGR